MFLDPNIKLFVTYNKPSQKIIKSDIIIPIQAGRAVATDLMEDIIGDDTGENISLKNQNYCELTTTYWCYKNFFQLGIPDYVGFMHYRRHFVFDKKFFNHTGSYVEFNSIEDNYLEKIGLTKKNVSEYLKYFDFIAPEKTKFNISIYEQFCSSHPKENLDMAINMVNYITPQIGKYINEYFNLTSGYFLNMFILNKNIFFEYCNYLFPVLFEIEKKINFEKYDSYQKRQLGFIAERLTGLFLYAYSKKMKVKELPISYILN